MYHDEEVRLIAYCIWEEGHPGRYDLEHWFKAEASVTQFHELCDKERRGP